MSRSLADVAPAFVSMAHTIVWCSAATVDRSGRPRSRVLHPIWEWDGAALIGWIATSPSSPKAADLASTPALALTYWAPSHDTCSASCRATWAASAEERAAGWDRFANGPAPVGYDPAIVPGWDRPTSAAFGILRLEPYELRVMPGSVMLRGEGERLAWRA